MSALANCAPNNWTFFPTDKAARVPLGGRLYLGLQIARALRAEVRRHPHSLAHIFCGSDSSGWGLREGLLHARLCRRAELPVLLHLHASALPQLLAHTRPESRLFVTALRRIDAVAVPSTSSAELLEARGLPAEKICIIPNSVPRRPWDPRESSKDSPLRLLLVGSIEPRKGIEVLLDALEKVAQRRPGTIEVDAFGPPGVGDSQLLAWQTRGELVGLRFCGALSPEDVQRELRASDGLLLPSLAECQPFALLEAMAASRPVIASNCGGIAHLLRGGAGECIRAGDAQALADALMAWIDDPARLGDLARAGWDRVGEEHSLAEGLAATKEAWRTTAGKDWVGPLGL
jgi:glycosyltransferase involved in cell wall biosynthesis